MNYVVKSGRMESSNWLVQSLLSFKKFRVYFQFLNLSWRHTVKAWLWDQLLRETEWASWRSSAADQFLGQTRQTQLSLRYELHGLWLAVGITAKNPVKIRARDWLDILSWMRGAGRRLGAGPPYLCRRHFSLKVKQVYQHSWLAEAGPAIWLDWAIYL